MTSPLEDNGITEIGITDDSVFAIYEGTRIEVQLNKEDWGDTMKRLELETAKIIPEEKEKPTTITKIIQELTLDYYQGLNNENEKRV